jgi:hypothetical protein
LGATGAGAGAGAGVGLGWETFFTGASAFCSGLLGFGCTLGLLEVSTTAGRGPVCGGDTDEAHGGRGVPEKTKAPHTDYGLWQPGNGKECLDNIHRPRPRPNKQRAAHKHTIQSPWSARANSCGERMGGDAVSMGVGNHPPPNTKSSHFPHSQHAHARVHTLCQPQPQRRVLLQKKGAHTPPRAPRAATPKASCT